MSAETVHIRTFEWDDWDAVVGLWGAVGSSVLPQAEIEGTRRRTPELFLVAETGSGVVAGAALGTYDGRRGFILRLAVDPAQRRRGIARHLVAELEGRLRALGCPRINLFVLPDNAAGLRFWQSLGYLPVPDVVHTKPL
ncbi:GNAT family N-acetyltransferase [Dactylosporangium sp. NPDC051541]|uniref:GNAT family N-acetyltransferase n=1 Tax=Dactylosporangium sp. NPDC051541 TaxID=3363977 RepID=UPI0037B48FA6